MAGNNYHRRLSSDYISVFAFEIAQRINKTDAMIKITIARKNTRRSINHMIW